MPSRLITVIHIFSLCVFTNAASAVDLTRRGFLAGSTAASFARRLPCFTAIDAPIASAPLEINQALRKFRALHRAATLSESTFLGSRALALEENFGRDTGYFDLLRKLFVRFPEQAGSLPAQLEAFRRDEDAEGMANSPELVRALSEFTLTTVNAGPGCGTSLVAQGFREEFEAAEEEFAGEFKLSAGEAFAVADEILRFAPSRLTQAALTELRPFTYSRERTDAYLVKIARFAPDFAARLSRDHSAERLRKEETLQTEVYRLLRISRLGLWKKEKIRFHFISHKERMPIEMNTKSDYLVRIEMIDEWKSKLDTRVPASDFRTVLLEELATLKSELAEEMRWVRPGPASTPEPWPTRAVPSPARDIPGIDPALVAYRHDVEAEHHPLFKSILELAYQVDIASLHDNQIANRFVRDWLAKYGETFAWIEAEVAQELGLHQAEVYDAIDMMYNSDRVGLAFIKPGTWLYSVDHYDQKLIDLYITKVEAVSPPMATILRKKTSPGDWLETQVWQAIKAPSSALQARDYGVKQLGLRYDLNITVGGRKRPILHFISVQRFGPTEMREVTSSYTLAMSRVDASLAQVSKRPGSSLRDDILRRLAHHRGELALELAEFSSRASSTLEVYRKRHESEIRRRAGEARIAFELGELIRHIDLSRAAFLAIDQVVNKTAEVVTDRRCELTLLEAPPAVELRVPVIETDSEADLINR